MIGRLTLKTNDPPHATSFYEQLPGPVGARRKIKSESRAARSVRPTQTSLGAIKPYDDNAAMAGNGAILASSGQSR
ncbi:MAG: hypothetical protein ING75_02800 [Rhodocyclaceae bacterium]|nr:hypothetical protein [Rhodocyclaceae bacterium]